MGRRQHTQNIGRAEIACRAAHLLAEGEADGFDNARRRAARELGAALHRELPDNLELHRALIAYLQLFHGAAHATLLAHLRSVAFKAIRLLTPFQPALVGPVLYGTACGFTPISLHLRCDEFEAVTRFLLDRRIIFQLIDTQVRLSGLAAAQRVVKIGLHLYDETFELMVLPAHNARQPISAIDGRPMRRADAAALEALLDSNVVFTGDFAGRPAVGP